MPFSLIKWVGAPFFFQPLMVQSLVASLDFYWATCGLVSLISLSSPLPSSLFPPSIQTTLDQLQGFYNSYLRRYKSLRMGYRMPFPDLFAFQRHHGHFSQKGDISGISNQELWRYLGTFPNSTQGFYNVCPDSTLLSKYHLYLLHIAPVFKVFKKHTHNKPTLKTTLDRV